MVPSGTLITVHRGLLPYQIDGYATPEFPHHVDIFQLQQRISAMTAKILD